MRVLLKTRLHPYTGIGNTGIGLARALSARGIDVRLSPTRVGVPLPGDVAELLTRPPEAPFDLLIVHELSWEIFATPDEVRTCRFRLGWGVVASTGVRGPPEDWRRRLSSLNAWASWDPITFQAMSTVMPAAVAHLLVAPGIDLSDWRYLDRDWSRRPFRFLMAGRLDDRKDPGVAVEAYRELRAEHADFDAELHLKTSIPSIDPTLESRVPGLKVHTGLWSRPELEDLYASAHVLLAPSRHEGLNLPTLEFQATGGVVIATDWGGHKSWLDPAYSYPLQFTLQPSPPARGGPEAMEAQASKQHLKDLMWRLYNDREEACDKGRLASQVVPVRCSWEKALDRLFDALQEPFVTAQSARLHDGPG